MPQLDQYENRATSQYSARLLVVDAQRLDRTSEGILRNARRTTLLGLAHSGEALRLAELNQGHQHDAGIRQPICAAPANHSAAT